ncbi:serine hydrolase domain-containing protein [Niabella soli]|uniref:Beta-lactamase n=1 Tax=Niabella soli DSM 19437 TaxID=929713 RepID=W0EVF5_9BACT|nr:serine hydrolase domain-containing protein [Niabella soli]AHF14762.1 beta-lactamase [Niabella soli DSM 19437]
MRRFIITLAGILLTIGCKLKSQDKKEKIQVAPAVLIAQNPDPISDAEKAKYAAELDAFFNAGLLRHGFNGGILVAKGGNVLYERYHGFKNPNNKADSIDQNTPFHLASTSKPFTAITVLKLVQNGKLGLTDPVTKFFPAFPYTDVTIENLLSHRSGLPNYLSVMEDKQKWNPKQMISNQDVLNFLIQYRPPIMFKANTRFTYCNTNFVLLALIVEKVTGQKFPDYVKATIFDPLQMNHTFIYTPADSGQVIMSYKGSGALWTNDIFENTYGDKNVYSTPEDMFKWDRALYNPNFIRPSLLDSAFQPHSHEKASMHNYGLGWRMLNLPNGKNVIYHNGKWHGFTPAFARLLDEKAVIIILGNRLNSNIYNQAKKAYDFFGDYMQGKVGSVDEEGEGNAPAAPAAAEAAAVPARVAKTPQRAGKTVARKAVKSTKKSTTSSHQRTKTSATKKAVTSKQTHTATKKKKKK